MINFGKKKEKEFLGSEPYTKKLKILKYSKNEVKN